MTDPTAEAPKRLSATKRRTHRKSRSGCKQCKQRHAKCDEHRPTCVNCTTANLRCSYLDQPPADRMAAVRPTGSPSWMPSPSSSMSTEPSPVSFAAVIGAVVDGKDGSADLRLHRGAPPVFNLSHLALFHHLETEMLKPTILSINEEDVRPVAEMVVRSAISTPYLMDELLAFSALHMSILQTDPAEKAQYLHQAAELQTRALTLFNEAQPRVCEENCLAMFIFSSILGMHTLFDIVTSHRDFIEFLENFIRYLSLHRGVRSVTCGGWHVIRHTEMKHIINPIETVDRLQSQPQLSDDGNECGQLTNLLAASASRLGPAPFGAYSEAVKSLQWVFDQHRALPKSLCTHITLAWPIILPAEYIELLKQRQPEALVILTHWAVLLYEDREFWVFGNAGRFLIESIIRYLGAYYDEWLALPREVLGDV